MAIIYLKFLLLKTFLRLTSNGNVKDVTHGLNDQHHSILVLLKVGFTLPFQSPEMRGALTAPFHLFLCILLCIGSLFSVALSLNFLSKTRWTLSSTIVLLSPDFPLRFFTKSKQ